MPAMAAVSVPSIIGDHMVLQAGKELPIWGKADPGENVTVTFGKSEAKATADAKGKWMVKLPPEGACCKACKACKWAKCGKCAKASACCKEGKCGKCGKCGKDGKCAKPTEMTIAGKDSTIVIKDILVGQVWIGSGQSNMQWSVKNSNNAEQELALANHPNIRLFTVPNTVAGEPQDNCKGEWKVCTPETVPDFSAVLYFFGRDLHQALGVPFGLINTSWGGTPAESWTTRATLEGDPDFKHMVAEWDKVVADYPQAKANFDKAIAEWQQAADKAKAAGQPEPKKPDAPRGPNHPWRVAGLYNAMIAPLVPFSVQGAVWYQGESNAGRAYQYRKLFPAMITDWRKAWGYDLSFYFVQLANFTKWLPEPKDSDWAELREAQTMTLALPNSGMAVTIDIGNADDIHPRNKQDVGKRLALNALAKDYCKHVHYSGPMYKSMCKKGNAIEVKFDHAEGGLVHWGGAPLKGFSIAGADKKFVWAKACIKGKKVVVFSPDVKDPVAVRYAWAHNPECNLMNGAGLPASPFRTDDWPCITKGNK
jgi:sialate O-acetylesterase